MENKALEFLISMYHEFKNLKGENVIDYFLWRLILIIYNINLSPGIFIYLNNELYEHIKNNYNFTLDGTKKDLIISSYSYIFDSKDELTENYYYFGQYDFLKKTLNNFRKPGDVIYFVNNNQEKLFNENKITLQIVLHITSEKNYYVVGKKVGDRICITEKNIFRKNESDSYFIDYNLLDKYQIIFKELGNIHINIIEEKEKNYFNILSNTRKKLFEYLKF